MIVVFFHSLALMYPGLPYGSSGKMDWLETLLMYPPFSLLIAGHAAVCLFFIHSGFVLSYKYVGNPECTLQVITAIIKRPFRLVGVILFATLPVFSFLLTKDFWVTRLWTDYDVYLKCFYNVLMNPLTANMPNNPPIWTISTELWGSFLVFGACLLICNCNKISRFIFLLVLIFCLKNTFYFSFLLGMLLADFHKNWNVNNFIKYKNVISYIILIPALACCSYQIYLVQEKQYWTNISFIEGGYPMAGAMLLFVFVLCNDRIQKILTFKPLVFLGGISYSVYVLHWLILKRYTSQIMNFMSLNNNLYVSFFLTLTISTSIIIIAAWIVDKFVDKPCISLSGWFAKKVVSEIQSKIASSKIIQYAKTILSNIRNQRRRPRIPADSTEQI